jgi:hypothetical protein
MKKLLGISLLAGFLIINLCDVSRLYGAGHVVMHQMPVWIFAVMSSGLLLGFVVAGQTARALLHPSKQQPLTNPS